MTIFRLIHGQELNDEKSFNKYLKILSNKHPNFQKVLAQNQKTEKNELLSLSKAMEVSDIIWEEREKCETIHSHSSLNFGIVIFQFSLAFY